MTKFFKRFIGNKAFYKELLIVAFPIALQQLISSLVNFLDMVMIGNYGGSLATGAVSIANRYFLSMNNIVIYICISGGVFVSQYFGAKQFDKLRKVFGFILTMTIVFGIIVCLCGTVFSGDIIGFFSSTENASGLEMKALGQEYLFIIAFTFLPLSISNCFSFILRSMKITKIPLLSSGTAMIANCILNFIFIFGLGLGVKGAAYATLISRFVELLIMMGYYFKKKPAFYGNLKQIFTYDKSICKKIVKRGIPLVFAQVITEAMAIFVLFAYARIEVGNPANISAINISQQIVDMVIVLVGGMGTAAGVLVGTRLGAGKIEEARQNARWQIGYVFIFSIVSALLMLVVFTPLAPYMFNFNDNERQLLITIMTIHGISLPFMFYSLNIIFITRSGGYTSSPFFITNVPYLLIKLPLIILFVFIAPNLFYDNQFIISLMGNIGLLPSLIVFIFIIDKGIEVIRCIIAAFIYSKAKWYNNLAVEK